MSSNNPKVDVIMTLHEINQSLFDSINSVLASRNVKITLILVNDSYEAGEVLTKKFPGVKVLTTKGGQGFQKSLRIGLPHTKSQYIAFQDSDDLTHPDRIYEQLQFLQFNNADIVTCRLVKRNINMSRVISKGGGDLVGDDKYLSLLFGSYSANATWLVTRRVIKDQSFMTRVCRAADWYTAFNLFQKYKVITLDKKYYYYIQHKNQNTRSKNYKDKMFLEIYPVWIKCNEFYKLPFLKLDEARLIADPWNSGKFSSQVLVWQKEILNYIKKNDKKNLPNYKAFLGIRNLKYLVYSKKIFNFSLIVRTIRLSPWIIRNIFSQVFWEK